MEIELILMERLAVESFEFTDARFVFEVKLHSQLAERD
jgi:hypothetical protein